AGLSSGGPPARRRVALRPLRGPGRLRHARARVAGLEEGKKGRAPVVDSLGLTGPWLVGSGPATLRHPSGHRLPLLPLGPSGVHGPSPRRTCPSTLLDQRLPETPSLERELDRKS